TGRLAIIVESVGLAHPVGPAVVRGLGVGVSCDEVQRLGRRLYRRRPDEEAALAYVLFVRGGLGQSIGHPCAGPSGFDAPRRQVFVVRAQVVDDLPVWQDLDDAVGQPRDELAVVR